MSRLLTKDFIPAGINPAWYSAKSNDFAARLEQVQPCRIYRPKILRIFGVRQSACGGLAQRPVVRQQPVRRSWIGVVLTLSFLACQRPSLPVLGQIPEFRLTSQAGKTFTESDMRGKIWVADFIFTSCGGACPMMTERMKTQVQTVLQEMAQDRPDLPVGIVSFSVDPERDTPEKLAEYAKDHGADLKIWRFLTGPLQEITRTVVQGFKISMGKVSMVTPDPHPGKYPSEEEIFEVVHGEQFVLIDARGRIRGYYSSEGTGLRKLLADLRGLLKEEHS